VLRVAFLLLGSAAVAAHADNALRDSPWSFTVGGELRERYEFSRNRGFGLAGEQSEDYLLQRAMVHGEARYGEQSRAYVEIVSGLAAGLSSVSATQQDELDIHQAFVEFPVYPRNDELSVRLGRQELSFGSSRLVSTRDGPNLRRSFDALKLALVRRDNTRVDAFVSRPVAPRKGSWNDGSTHQETFWGAYAVLPLQGAPDVALDLYYLGLDRHESAFGAAVADELRHTLGTRVSGAREGLDWNVEAAGQWGAYGPATVRAWTLSADVGFTWSDVPASPRIGLKADAISGDRDSTDKRLATFNPLFPKLPYFSEANLVLPANLLDLQPTVTLHFTPQLLLQLSANVLWKHSREDGFYAPGAAPLVRVGDERFLGQQFSATLEWQPSRRVTFIASHVQFYPGAALAAAGGIEGSFTAAWVRLVFQRARE
jgi:hypothetical protein